MRSPVSFHLPKRRLSLYVDGWCMTSKGLQPTPLGLALEMTLELGDTPYIPLTTKAMQTPLLLSMLCFRC